MKMKRMNPDAAVNADNDTILLVKALASCCRAYLLLLSRTMLNQAVLCSPLVLEDNQGKILVKRTSSILK
jgi:hypothetical protein